MKNTFTPKMLLSVVFVLVLICLGQGRVQAQTNWGLSANGGVFTHGGIGVVGTGGPALGPTTWAYNYGEYHYNNGIIPTYIANCLNSPNPAAPNYGPNDCFTFIPNMGYINVTWPFAAAVSAGGGIDKIVFYKNSRPLTNCVIMHYDGVLGTWDTVVIRYHGIVSKFYTDLSFPVADSIEIVGCKTHNHLNAGGRIPINPTANQDTIRIAGAQSGTQGPDFREIQVIRRGNCSGTPNTDIVGGIELGPQTAGPAPLAASLTLCPGFSAYMGATSAAVDTGHRYQWQINTGSGWVNVVGANGPAYVYNGVQNATFRVIDTCVASSLWAISNNTIQVNVSPDYTPLAAAGYLMSFDNAWKTSACLAAPLANNLPNDGGILNNWSTTPSSGYSTWRIDTTGSMVTPTFLTTPTNSGWTNSNSGAYSANLVTYPYGVQFPGGSRRSARLHTASPTFLPGLSSNMDFYVDMSNASVTGNKALYFYYINQGGTTTTPLNTAPNFNINDTLKVWMSTNAGNSWSLLGTFDTAQWFTKRMIPIVSNSAQTIIRFQGTKYASDNSDIGIDSVFIAAPCSGTPTAGKLKVNGNGMANIAFPVPGNTVAVCAGQTLTLTTLGTTMAGNLVYEWQQNTNAVNWVPVNGGYGYNSLFFRTPPIYDTVWYRLAVKCGATGTVVYSDSLVVTMSSPKPVYASIPYRQSFENWTSRCSSNDAPLSANGTLNWAINPFTSNNSWRRNDQGIASIWPMSTAVGAYSPTAAPTTGPGNNYSARFHSAGSQMNQKGTLDLLYNGLGFPGNKEVKFYYINTTGNDSLEVFSSSDAGANFTKIGGFTLNANWTQYTVQSPCNTATCIVRFQGTGDLGGQSDIGLDSVTVTPPCSGKPTAGNISFANPCAGTSFTLNLLGVSNTGGLTITWQRSVDSISWTTVPGSGNNTWINTTITQHMYFRAIVQCNYSNQADTTARRIYAANFYYCYCTSGSSSLGGANIGNVRIRRMPVGINVLNNGSANPQNNNPGANQTYSNFRNPPSTLQPTPLYHDSTYALTVTQINSGNFVSPGTTVSVWIDTNQNGAFDANERFMVRNSINTSLPPQVADTVFIIPPSTMTGITGMRITMEQGINGNTLPCGAFGSGETEDYLVEIRNHPCTGPANAGTISASDSSVCAGYTVTLIDTTHDVLRYGLQYVWQYSPDSNSWADIAGTQNRDTANHLVTAATWYRVRMICTMTGDTTYSNVLPISMNSPISCYCYSLANGGIKDTSDIGGFSITGSSGRGINIPAQGPHLLNPLAINSRTDYTKLDTLHLWLDSTYQIMVYHTLRTGFHGDAKVTLFMDLNNNLKYDISNTVYNEHIWTGFTTATYFTIIDSITIPHYAIPGVLTGMRLILNNNTGPNAPSDSACGPYTSGETEDYIVMFHDKSNPYWPTGVKNIGNIADLYVYPNPTEGNFTVSFETKKAVEKATITVTNITGQQLMKRNISKPGTKFSENFNITHLAQGVYIVELNADNERQIRKLVVK
ncbi:MAG: T9SS type A sorting domain-containing protein [Bacteroidetes bacterium]|nr:T9SS type A sorting domain-containing protein [Bacteroidota bacterium]MBS1738943.1 T9SS type A sorting domain-containing protein [Bacteroidota bacterium]